MSEDERLDHWRDCMVAALYGELPPAERRELDRALAADETLRRDWGELQQARATLQDLAHGQERELPVPTVLDGAWAGASAKHRLRRWLVPAGAGFAAAALLFLGLLLSGLRVDRTPAGLLVRVDGSPAAELEAARGMVPAAGERGVTRAEFAELAQVVMDATAARLDELERRQTGAQVELTQALYDALAVHQERQYDDLRNRIELAGMRGQGPGSGRGLATTTKGGRDERR